MLRHCNQMLRFLCIQHQYYLSRASPEVRSIPCLAAGAVRVLTENVSQELGPSDKEIAAKDSQCQQENWPVKRSQQ